MRNMPRKLRRLSQTTYRLTWMTRVCKICRSSPPQFQILHRRINHLDSPKLIVSTIPSSMQTPSRLTLEVAKLTSQKTKDTNHCSREPGTRFAEEYKIKDQLLNSKVYNSKMDAWKVRKARSRSLVREYWEYSPIAQRYRSNNHPF